jgi:hypothetical protein
MAYCRRFKKKLIQSTCFLYRLRKLIANLETENFANLTSDSVKQNLEYFANVFEHVVKILKK